MDKISNTFKLTTGLDISHFDSVTSITNHINSKFHPTKKYTKKKIYGDIINLKCFSTNSHIIDISLENHLMISIIYLDYYKNVNGYFLIGPYCTKKNDFVYNSVPYKEKICIKYCANIFLDIFNDSHQDDPEEKQNIISLHVKNAVDYIHKNYDKPITVEEMSKILNINKCYLCNTFKKETGYTFSNFLCKFRIQKSLELLCNPSLSILSVAISVGFANQSYYTMAFKKINNMTPLEYRRSNMKPSYTCIS